MRWFKEVKAKAPVDETLSILEGLRDEGYENVMFAAHIGACDECRSHDGETKSIDQVIAETEYAAPIYSWSHIGCLCELIVMGPDKENVRLNYSGEV